VSEPLLDDVGRTPRRPNNGSTHATDVGPLAVRKPSCPAVCPSVRCVSAHLSAVRAPDTQPPGHPCI